MSLESRPGSASSWSRLQGHSSLAARSLVVPDDSETATTPTLCRDALTVALSSISHSACHLRTSLGGGRSRWWCNRRTFGTTSPSSHLLVREAKAGNQRSSGDVGLVSVGKKMVTRHLTSSRVLTRRPSSNRFFSQPTPAGAHSDSHRMSMSKLQPVSPLWPPPVAASCSIRSFAASQRSLYSPCSIAASIHSVGQQGPWESAGGSTSQHQSLSGAG